MNKSIFSPFKCNSIFFSIFHYVIELDLNSLTSSQAFQGFLCRINIFSLLNLETQILITLLSNLNSLTQFLWKARAAELMYLFQNTIQSLFDRKSEFYYFKIRLAELGYM